MNWIDVIWPMMSAACAMLGVIHAAIWLKRRHRPANLAFAAAALSLAVVALMELSLMRAQDARAYASILRLAFIPLASLVCGLVVFVLLEFRAGNRLFASLAVSLRLACLLPNFLTGENLAYLHVDTLQRIPAWAGAEISIPGADSVPNPWFPLDMASDVVLMCFVASAIVDLHRGARAPARRRALATCYAMMLFVTFAMVWNSAVLHLSVSGPMMITPAFLVFLMLMGYELGLSMLRAGQLEQDLSSAETELDDIRRRMDMAVRASGVGLLTWDRERGQTWVSDEALAIIGCQQGDACDLATIRMRLLPEERKRFDDMLAVARDNDGEFIAQYRLAHPGGKPRWVLMGGKAEFASDGAQRRLHAAVLDITDRMEAEERFRLIVRSAPTAMLMFDGAGTVVLANARAEAVFGYTTEAFPGIEAERVVPLQAIHDGRRGPSMSAGLAAMSRAGEDGRDLAGRRSDGSEVPIRVALTSIPADSEVLLLASIADLSDAKRLEHELALQRDELAHLSRVALLSELSGSLAHELNQPLTAILANAQGAIRFLSRDPPDLEEVRDALLSIVESDKRAGEVIRRLRALLRKDRADFRYLDINEVIDSVLRIIRSDLLNKHIEIVLDLAEDLPRVCGDVVQLQQVLLNLIVNASDAMGDADARTITLRTAMAAPGYVVVSVSDIGPGIPEEDVEKIFTPFFTTKRDGLGLGLGLPVCRTILSAHHGRIWAANNADRGATVSFELDGGDRDAPVNGHDLAAASLT